MKTLLFGFAVLLYTHAAAQSYHVTTATKKYQELQHPVWIKMDAKTNTGILKIPFSCHSFGHHVDFGKDDQSTIVFPSFIVGITSPDSGVAYSPFYGAYVGLRNPDSSVAYEVTGKKPNRVLKVQWKNVLLKRHDTTDYANFQIWLNEKDGQFYVHVGPTEVHGNAAFMIGDSDNLMQVNGPQIGIYEVDITGHWSKKAELTGDPHSPGVTRTFPDEGVNGVPAENMLYTFEPE